MNTAVKWFGIIAMLAITIVAIANTALALPVTIQRVEVNDDVIDVNAANRIDFERDGELEVEVRLSASQDIDDVEIEAFISGYEYNDDKESQLSDSSALFDMEAGVDYVKRLNLRLPDDVDSDDYKLRILVSDRNGAETIQVYNLKIEGTRHIVKILDVVASDTRVKPGSALLTTVRVENQGQLDETDVKVTVSIPELGISASDYIDNIDNDDQKDSEELYLRIPTCAKAGIYQLKAEISYDRDHETMSKTTPIEIVESDSCAPKVTADATTVVVQQQPVVQAVDTTQKTSSIKTALEVILLVLIGLLVVIGIVLGLSRMRDTDEE